MTVFTSEHLATIVATGKQLATLARLLESWEPGPGSDWAVKYRVLDRLNIALLGTRELYALCKATGVADNGKKK